MTLYDINQANYANLPTLTDEQLAKLIPYIVDFLDKNKSKYYLMLEKEQRYYTFFTFPRGNYNPGKLAREIISLAQELGDIKSIEVDELGTMLEIWIVNHGECTMYGLFDYAGGVIEVS